MAASEIQLGVEEGLLTLRELSEIPEIQNARLSFSRLRAWAFLGFKGQKLPTILIGGVRYTTVERTLLFAAQCGNRDGEESLVVVLPKTIPSRAATYRKRLEQMLYGKKNGSRKNPK